MSTAAHHTGEPRIRDIEVSDRAITAHLMDGRIISVPLDWSWRLESATPTQRQNFVIMGDGDGVHWPEIDEDINARGMLEGSPAPRRRK